MTLKATYVLVLRVNFVTRRFGNLLPTPVAFLVAALTRLNIDVGVLRHVVRLLRGVFDDLFKAFHR